MPHLADVDRVHADIHLRVDKGVVGPDEALHDGGFYLRVAYVTQQKLSLFAVKKHHVDLPGEGGGGTSGAKMKHFSDGAGMAAPSVHSKLVDIFAPARTVFQ